MKSIAITLILLASVNAKAQNTDTLKVGTVFKDFKKLYIGSYQYEVYSERDGKRLGSVNMTSTTTKETIDGNPYIAIKHAWDGTNFKGGFYSLVEPKTMKPIIHIRTNNEKKEAFKFTSNSIVGLDSASNNAASDYNLILENPMFNFEIDLETLSILPLKVGRTLAVPFFHPGSTMTQPMYYPISMEKIEMIDIPGKGESACFVLFMDYNGTQPTRFWYTLKDRQFVKMEGKYNGINIFKTRKFDQ